MKKIVLVLIVVLVFNSFCFASEFSPKFEENEKVNHFSSILEVLTPFAISIPMLRIKPLPQVSDFLPDWKNKTKNTNLLKKNVELERINGNATNENKLVNKCPIKYFETENSKKINIIRIFENGSEYLDKLKLEVPKRTKEYNNKIEYEDIIYDGKKIGINLKVYEIDNVNELYFKNDKDWSDFIKLIDKRKVSSKIIINESGEEEGVAYIFESEVDGFSNEIHVYDNNKNRYINLFWSEFKN